MLLFWIQSISKKEIRKQLTKENILIEEPTFDISRKKKRKMLVAPKDRQAHIE